MSDVAEIMVRVRELQAQKDELLQKLDISLAIQRLCPEAFTMPDGGSSKAQTCVTGQPFDGLTLHVKRVEDGEQWSWPISVRDTGQTIRYTSDEIPQLLLQDWIDHIWLDLRSNAYGCRNVNVVVEGVQ